jgi:hypothetical protein
MPDATKEGDAMETLFHRVVYVLASVAVLSLALVFVESPAANAQGAWTATGTQIDGTVDLHSVSCASVAFCVAVDGQGNAITYNGSSWSPPVDVDGSVGFLYSVSCPNTTFCAAVGDSNVITYNGSSWSTPAPLVSGSSAPPTSVSCPSAQFCVAAIGNVTATYNGSSWSSKSGGAAGFDSVSCASTTFCVAVGNDDAVIYNGSSWSAPVAIGVGVENQSSVSCSSVTFCAAVGSSDAATYDGSSWSAPSDIDGNYILSSVSCPNVNFCFAIDEAGRALTYDGSSWSAPMALTDITFLRAVSCPTASFCAAVGDGGVAVMFTSPTSSVLAPSTGATLSGSTYLDASASNATSVEFRLFGSSYGYNAPVLCTATPTLYGWVCAWNTTTVPNGSYILLSEASNSAGSTFSSGVGITLKNPPTTSVLIPSKGATLSGTSATLDASASNATSVEFLLFGGVYGYNAPAICTASPTYYGWVCNWNTTAVPNGSYTLVSYASGQGGSTASSGVSITLHN